MPIQEGLTALMMASQHGNTKIVEVLVKAHADVNICENVRQLVNTTELSCSIDVCINRQLAGVLCSLLPRRVIWKLLNC